MAKNIKRKHCEGAEKKRVRNRKILLKEPEKCIKIMQWRNKGNFCISAELLEPIEVVSSDARLYIIILL